MKNIALIILTAIVQNVFSQNSVEGYLTSNGKPVSFAGIGLLNSTIGTSSQSDGFYSLKDIPNGKYTIVFSMIGFELEKRIIDLNNNDLKINIELKEASTLLKEVVVSGTMKEVTKLNSPVAVEVYNSNFFIANPSPSIFESMQNINGIRPQINCNVCNTGDIHINGLEGPYTMVLIDGMPIVSGLSTVYGLTGIPQSLIERVEIVKGPSSSLYGSEAVGGLINIITKKTNNAPIIFADIFRTSWQEYNTDLGIKFINKKAQSIVGINYFNYQNPLDNNLDGFTDITLQDRYSIFNKWSFKRKENRKASIAARYIKEDRWGGQMDWQPIHRGGDDIYGESIYTNRWEIFGLYQLPTQESVNLQYSANRHQQNSVYGDTWYIADQIISFTQLTWNKKINIRNDLLAGLAYRYSTYDDNTPATQNPDTTYLPGIFIQNEYSLNDQSTLLMGIRWDYNNHHGSIYTPRLNYKWASLNKKQTLRWGMGNGFRVANIFTEDHAALTGAREVIFAQELAPETSWNTNLNYVKSIYTKNNTYINIDATLFYTYFLNRIIPDYESNVNQIIYDNLDGNAISKGISISTDITASNGLKIMLGTTIQEVTLNENNQTTHQLLTERLSGVWNVNYTWTESNIKIDYTGNVYGPMRLPLLGPLDDRPSHSPWYSIQNIQITKVFKKGFECYGGIKNLLNFTPPANSIARAFDPFDKAVTFDNDGNAIASASNPNALTFDPSYVYASNQGLRTFIGIRYTF